MTFNTELALRMMDFRHKSVARDLALLKNAFREHHGREALIPSKDLPEFLEFVVRLNSLGAPKTTQTCCRLFLASMQSALFR